MSNDKARRVSTYLAAIQESATLTMDAKAKALKAAGRPVTGFGAGEPDFPTPEFIVEVAAEAARDPKNHKYTPAKGLPELRKTIVVKTLRDSDSVVDPNDVAMMNGGEQAVFQVFAAPIDDGDEVLPPAPYWTTYPKTIRLADDVPVEVFTGADAEYKTSVEQLETVRVDKIKVLFLYSSSNPTGSVYSLEEIQAIGQRALESGIRVISDEIYERLVYDGTPVSHVLSEAFELADRAVALNGVAKTYAMTGRQANWIYDPSGVIKAAVNFQSHTTSNVANASQRTALAVLTRLRDVVAQMCEAFDRRRRKMVEMLGAVNSFAVSEPEGAFYVYLNVEMVFGRDVNGKSATVSAELAAFILEGVEVVVVPGGAFGPSDLLRFSYTLSDKDLVEGLGRMQRLLG